MPITPYLPDGSFNPEEVRAMGVAFANACQSLGLRDVSDPMTKLIAMRIIEAAETGERDPLKLHEAVMLWAAHTA